MRRTKQAVQIFKNRGQLNQRIETNKAFIRQSIVISRFGHKTVVPIKMPEYKSKKYFITHNKSCHPFVELTADYVKWLQDFSDRILQTEKDERYAFLNPELDFTNPCICGFRLYLSPENFIHVQVRKIPQSKSLYQLDYFESNPEKEPDLLMVLCVDITSNGFYSPELIYAAPNLVLIDDNMSKRDSDLEYADRITRLFREIIVYMRPFDYSSTGNHCLILPFPCFDKEQTEEFIIHENLPD